MNEQNLYKFVFTNENGTIANVIASARKSISDRDAFKFVAKEVASNYCEDNHCPYDEKFVADMMDCASVQNLGTYKPNDEYYSDEDTTIILLSKTKRWRVR